MQRQGTLRTTWSRSRKVVIALMSGSRPREASAFDERDVILNGNPEVKGKKVPEARFKAQFTDTPFNKAELNSPFNKRLCSLDTLRLAEMDRDDWLDFGALTSAEKMLIEERFREIETSPQASLSWADAKERL